MDKPLSNDELVRFLGVGLDSVLKYSQLADYATIDEVLPKDGALHFRIILLEERFNRGHWVVLLRMPSGALSYMNSYGERYDTDLCVVPRIVRRILGEDRREISRLLDGAECQWNHLKMQGARSETCGRYCVLYVSMAQMGYTLPEWVEWMKAHKGEFGSYDLMVRALVK